jgi:hypothetical protein
LIKVKKEAEEGFKGETEQFGGEIRERDTLVWVLLLSCFVHTPVMIRNPESVGMLGMGRRLESNEKD